MPTRKCDRKYKGWWSKHAEHFGCILCSKLREAFNKAMKVMFELVIDLQKMVKEQANDSLSKEKTMFEMSFGIKDLKSVLTKGRPTQTKAT